MLTAEDLGRLAQEGRIMPDQSHPIATRRIIALLLALVCAVASAVVTVSPSAAANNRGPGFVDPRTNVTLYRSLSAHWWQWAFSTADAPGGPFRDGRVDCSVNQPLHHVLFLAAPFNVTGTADRTCTRTVDRGTLIFVPVINTECSNREKRPFFGATPGQRRVCVKDDLFNPAGLRASVDRQSFPVTQARFSILSRDFPFRSVAGNPAIGTAVPGHSTSRGVWLLLEPLRIGKHTITFAGSYPNADFAISVTYHLTVA